MNFAAFRQKSPFIKIDLTNMTFGEEIWKLNESTKIWTIFQKTYIGVVVKQMGEFPTWDGQIRTLMSVPLVADQFDREDFFNVVKKKSKSCEFFEIVNGDRCNLYAQFHKLNEGKAL